MSITGVVYQSNFPLFYKENSFAIINKEFLLNFNIKHLAKPDRIGSVSCYWQYFER